MQEMQETWVGSLGWEDPLKEGMAIHSSILAWRIPWTEEPSRLQFMGSELDTTEVTQHTPVYLPTEYSLDRPYSWLTMVDQKIVTDG